MARDAPVMGMTPAFALVATIEALCLGRIARSSIIPVNVLKEGIVHLLSRDSIFSRGVSATYSRVLVLSIITQFVVR